MSLTDALDGDAERAHPAPADPAPGVSACRTSPERTVFTEKGHSNAWIATDLTVSVER